MYWDILGMLRLLLALGLILCIQGTVVNAWQQCSMIFPLPDKLPYCVVTACSAGDSVPGNHPNQPQAIVYTEVLVIRQLNSSTAPGIYKGRGQKHVKVDLTVVTFFSFFLFSSFFLLLFPVRGR